MRLWINFSILKQVQMLADKANDNLTQLVFLTGSTLLSLRVAGNPQANQPDTPLPLIAHA